MEEPRPARGASRAVVEELVHAVRAELLRRAESPSGEWVEESTDDLVSGAKPGWYFPVENGGGLAFYARRGSNAYGHVHAAGDPPGSVGRAEALANHLLRTLPHGVTTIDLGFTGLLPPEERAVAARLADRPGSLVIARRSMERPLTAEDGAAIGGVPGGGRLAPVRAITLDALTDLDWRAFEGTIDGLVIGATREEYRRVLESLLAGRVGRFLDEASTAVLDGDPPRLVGAILTTEQSPRRALFVDLMVDPVRRRQGLGRFLMRWGLRALRAFGYESARLWVTDANTAAQGLYASLGFRTQAEATLYRWERPAPQPQVER